MIKIFIIILTILCFGHEESNESTIDLQINKEDILKTLEELNKVPDFTLQDYDGNKYNIRSLEGKVVLLNFWAAWCYPCRLEIPDFNKMHDQYGEDFIILAISISDTKKQLIDFAKLYKTKYPLLYGPPKVIDKILMDYGGIFSVPTSILINKKGEQVFSYPGAILEQSPDGVYAYLNNKIVELLNETPAGDGPAEEE